MSKLLEIWDAVVFYVCVKGYRGWEENVENFLKKMGPPNIEFISIFHRLQKFDAFFLFLLGQFFSWVYSQEITIYCWCHESKLFGSQAPYAISKHSVTTPSRRKDKDAADTFVENMALLMEMLTIHITKKAERLSWKCFCKAELGLNCAKLSLRLPSSSALYGY